LWRLESPAGLSDPERTRPWPIGTLHLQQGELTILCSLDGTDAKPDGEKTMTTLSKRSNTALLIIDMQVGVIAKAHQRDAVAGNVATLVVKARQEHVPVIWVRHADDQLIKGSDAWQIVPELNPGDTEPVVEKTYGDAFEDTGLEAELSRREVGRLVVVGAQSDACIRSTIHGALVRGYDVTLVSDAHTTEDLSEWGAPPPDQVIAHTNLYWSHQTAPGRKAAAVKTQDVDWGAAP
jgi:isochorismate hydrolase